MMTAEQRDEALAALARARKVRDSTIAGAYQTFNDLVRAYEEAGIPVNDIAGAAGLTRSRIYQIRDEK
jgi:ssDNA-specific exonuclease RecJ